MPVLVCRCLTENDLYSVMDDIDDIDGLCVSGWSGFACTIEYPEGDRLPDQLKADSRVESVELLS